jgi:outer membrane lipopolysaccharide assembly protein LptE/RlpB
MIRNYIYILILTLSLNGCGFTPLYKENKNLNFSINVINTSGDRKVNEAIKSNLQRYSKLSDNKKNYNANIKSEVIEQIVSKNKTGVISQIKLIIKVNFSLLNKEENIEFEFSEELNIKKTNNIIDDNFYENQVKENMGISISEKLIFALTKSE